MSPEQSHTSNATGQLWNGLYNGLRAPLMGLLLLFKNRSLWPYAMPAFILGLTWALLALTQANVPAGDYWWSKSLWWLLATLLSTGIMLVQLLIALAAPLLDLLSEQTEEELNTLPDGPPFWREIVSLRFWKNAFGMIFEALKLLLFKWLLLLASLLLALIPVVGVYIAYPLSGIATGIDFLDYPLARRHWSLGAKIRLLRRHAGACIAYGLISFLLLEIPGVGGIMLAPIAIGGTWLIYALGEIHFAPEAVTAPQKNQSTASILRYDQ